jgi:hypothetical protein
MSTIRPRHLVEPTGPAQYELVLIRASATGRFLSAAIAVLEISLGLRAAAGERHRRHVYGVFAARSAAFCSPRRISSPLLMLFYYSNMRILLSSVRQAFRARFSFRLSKFS